MLTLSVAPPRALLLAITIFVLFQGGDGYISEGCVALAAALSANPTLVSLELSHNDLCIGGRSGRYNPAPVMAILSAVSTDNNVLNTLDISYNRLSELPPHPLETPHPLIALTLSLSHFGSFSLLNHRCGRRPRRGGGSVYPEGAYC
jgi:hypothetical protein